MKAIGRCWAVCCGGLVTVPLMLMTACGGRHTAAVRLHEADSLNEVSYRWRYKDLNVSARAARRAYELTEDFPELRAEALNNRAYYAFMRMDFEGSERLYQQAARLSNNEIERLVADVGRMKICQRTSRNKAFYDYRNDAMRRIRRIQEDEALITDEHAVRRLNYALSEFYIVSAIYYYYLQQHDASLRAIHAVTQDMVAADTAQWLYYEYMVGSGDMYEAPTPDEETEGEFLHLANCLLVAKRNGYTYFEANALQGMAELLTDTCKRKRLEERRLGLLRLVNVEGLPTDSLPLAFGRRALSLFKQYGDWYQISGTYRTLAAYYNSVHSPEMALSCLAEALEYVNIHHERYYHCNDTTHRLRTFETDTGESIEMKWIEKDGICTVPEWILRLREQISLTYSAMGKKNESDYNRNIYLDLLDYTRQDKELELRFAALEAEGRQLNLMLALLLSGCVVWIGVSGWLSSRWRQRNQQYLAVLKRVLELCRRITAAVPPQAHELEDIVAAIETELQKEFAQLFHTTAVRILLAAEEEPSANKGAKRPVKFPLVPPGQETPVAEVALYLSAPLSKEVLPLLRLVIPYVAWTVQNGGNLVSLDDECRKLEKERYIHAQHLADNKCANTAKKACFSIVTGILPYIDRVANEVHKLKAADYARQPEVRKGKYAYIRELIDKINEYNDILALWIKMRQGALSLNIENFELEELFRIIAKGKRSFEQKCLTLKVDETAAIVKADKALTLFMINTLVENARKYTQAGGTIALTADETAHYVEIAVTDNGPGLSETDVRHILEEKVYQPETIGWSTAPDVEQLRKQKGHGFGLMNCKGIIEKYRKTNAVFDVCRFFIESVPGQGSRFCFRLPKGVRRLLLAVGVWTAVGAGGASCTVDHQSSAPPVATASDDSLLAQANRHANQVYFCNVNARFQEALVHADSVLQCLNRHYVRYSGKDSPQLALMGDTAAAEQTWLEQEFDTDYYILLDVRNEVAVAALALNDFPLYTYNNAAYVTLYRLISRDRNLQQYCEQMQHSATNKMIGLSLLGLLLAGGLAGYYILYFRHRLHYRMNMEQVFAINRALFAATKPADTGAAVLTRQWVDRLFAELNELLPLADMALAVCEEESHRLHYTFVRENSDQDTLRELMALYQDRAKAVWNKEQTWSFLPLWVEAGGERHCTGVLALKLAQALPHEEDLLLAELAAGYLAVVLYNSVVRVRSKQYDIELAQDETCRIAYEENLLHVQNMVLDNCLSTIKHETVYYPNRIRRIVELLDREGALSADEEQQQLQTMEELVHYYKGIFGLLSSCAARQLDEVTFRRNEVEVGTLLETAGRYWKKRQGKLPFTAELEVQPAVGWKVSADRTLVDYLLRNLMDEAMLHRQSGRLCLKAIAQPDGFVRFDFMDFRRSPSQEALNQLFYPDRQRMGTDAGQGLSGTEYLVCKQIVRDHDEYAGRRGCRINATALPGGGFTVWWTLPMRY